MTDNEIIKALELCSYVPQQCSQCPYYGRKDCVADSAKDAIDLIQRQQKYIDKSVKDLKWWLDTNEENGVVHIPKFVVENIVKGVQNADQR